jgi:hypothetical protein
VYDPTHYEMGLTIVALTFEAVQANEGHDPKGQDHGRQLHKQQDDQQPRGGYQLPYDAPRDQEAMTKATTRPRHIGRLANHHRVYSAATTGTVAPRLPMLRCGHKTTMTTMPGCALHQDKTSFLANQVS